MLQLRLHSPAFGGVKKPSEVKLLAGIGHVDDPVGLEFLCAVLDRRQIGGGIKEGTVGFADEIGFFGNGRISNHRGPLADFGDFPVQQGLDDPGQILVIGAFSAN